MNVRKMLTVGEVLHSANQHSENQPQRTCIGCRQKAARSELLRLVAEGSGSTAVLVDERRRMAGRGAWLHPSESCLALAVKRRAFGRALNGATGATAVERRILAGEQAAGLLQKSEPVPLADAAQTVQPESGSEN
ncbi:YlxR family protein [Pseudarthrobacter sulfonivorans]|uniref:YlxR family protein n=1 Tax=Pseudarthrobacter sulfonivorans TaxID=121292 RepID=UPI002102B2F7|nr:YlxR family protein [Pseudarthrobacter sulfonivorans]